MKAFDPLRTKVSPNFRALVRRLAASDPAPGSVRQYEAIESRLAIAGAKRRRRSSEPNRSTIQAAMLWIDRKAETVTSP